MNLIDLNCFFKMLTGVACSTFKIIKIFQAVVNDLQIIFFPFRRHTKDEQQKKTDHAITINVTHNKKQTNYFFPAVTVECTGTQEKYELGLALYSSLYGTKLITLFLYSSFH